MNAVKPDTDTVLLLRLPALEDEEILEDYVREHREYGCMDDINGLGLENDSFAKWVLKVHLNAEYRTPAYGRGLLLLAFEEEQLIGIATVRPDLSKELALKYGHAGYEVRPSMRRKGYAVKMVMEELKICRAYGLKSVIFGCDKENTASSGVIRKCGGILIAENDRYQKGRTGQYYEIRTEEE